MNGKEITIDEVLEEMQKLKARYYFIAHLLHKNFQSIRLKGVTPKEIMVKGGYKTADKILITLGKCDDLSNELDSVKKAYYTYKDLLISLIREKEKTTSVDEMIVFYRDKMHYSFDEIAIIYSYSKRQIIRKYKNVKDVTQCH